MSTLDLAPIGNCSVASLVAKDGRHVWFCFPRLDGDPLFNALLQGEAPARGFADVVIRDQATVSQSYLFNTAILETIVEDKAGARLQILDFAPRFRRQGRMFRPPMLVRRLVPLVGRPRCAVRVRPSFDYGSAEPRLTVGSNHVRFVGPHAVLRVTTDMSITYLCDETEFALHRPVTLFIGADESIPEGPEALALSFLSETEAYWKDWVRNLAVPFDWQEAVIRAAITLKLCSFEDTGAIMAALTTSLPEAANSQRTWDYRYCWPRDAYFTVNALNQLGATLTMERYLRFIVDAAMRIESDMLPPLFSISAELPPAEIEAKGLAGYRGMGPVRVGNSASVQTQNDAYGSVILSAAQMFWDKRLAARGDTVLYAYLVRLGRVARRLAFEPDSGPWEYRGRARVHTYSAAMCWAGLHRLGRIARKLGLEDESANWHREAEELRTDILRRATTAEGWLSGALDAEVADASSLVLAEIGLVPAMDPRFIRTIEIVQKRLLRLGFIMRYDEADDFGLPETAFLVCTFWYIDALASVGRRDEAKELFANLLQRRNHVGLLAEDIHPVTGELWGNFPQTYSQVGLIKSAMRLSRSWEDGLWRAP